MKGGPVDQSVEGVTGKGFARTRATGLLGFDTGRIVDYGDISYLYDGDEMSNLMTTGLLVLFTVHLVVFLRMTVKHRRFDFFLASITFFALVLSNGLRLWRPNFGLTGLNPHTWLRAIAWSTTVAAFIAKSKIKKKKALLLSGNGSDQSATSGPQTDSNHSTIPDRTTSVRIHRKGDRTTTNDPTPQKQDE